MSFRSALQTPGTERKPESRDDFYTRIPTFAGMMRRGRRWDWAVTIDELIRSKRDEILGIATRYGTRNVRLFGSAARGEARPGSDIDILVDWERGRSLLDHVALMQDLEYLLGVRVDVVTRDALHASIREEILAEARPL